MQQHILPWEQTYPTISRWVTSYGWIEIGSDDHRVVLKALDEGGLVWESNDDYETLDEALQVLETGLAEWIQQNTWAL